MITDSPTQDRAGKSLHKNSKNNSLTGRNGPSQSSLDINSFNNRNKKWIKGGDNQVLNNLKKY